jgi:hypothetical protein
MHADTLLEEFDGLELSSELLGDELYVSGAAMIDSTVVGGRMDVILERNLDVQGAIRPEATRIGEMQMGADGSIFS